MTDEKREPCPFCGSTRLKESAVSNTGGNVRYIWCMECKAHGPWFGSGHPENRWNCRTEPQAGAKDFSWYEGQVDRGVVKDIVKRKKEAQAGAVDAAKHMDWQQVILNGGPPCFHLEGDRFCGRAQRWAGHGDLHPFVSLPDLLQSRPASEGDGFVTELPRRVLAMCKKRGWSLHWTARGAYLHLEASELIEAIRGKRGSPTAEAADVLIVLLSITEHNGILFADVVEQARQTVAHLEMADRYAGEEFAAATKEGQ